MHDQARLGHCTSATELKLDCTEICVSYQVSESRSVGLETIMPFPVIERPDARVAAEGRLDARDILIRRDYIWSFPAGAAEEE